MTRVKICGITDEADRDAAVAAGADALGFVVSVPVDTDRELAPARAAELVAGAPPFVTTVLVTMPDGPDRAADLVSRTGVDAIQIHDDATPGELRAVSDRTGARVIKTLPSDALADPDDADGPNGAGAVETACGYADAADALLVDSVDNAGAGGTGHTHDWEATRALRESVDVPVILAGGLSPDNVADAVRAVSPYAVDVSSGVERAEGRKDHEAVAAFVDAAKRAAGVARA